MSPTAEPWCLWEVRSALGRRGVEAALVERGEDAFWLTRFPSTYLLVLVTKGRSWIITDSRYELAVRMRQDLAAMFGLVVRRGPLEPLLAQLLRREGCRSLGYDPDHTTVARLEALRKGLGSSVRLKPVKALVSGLRAVKSGLEEALVRESLAVAERAFLEMMGRLRPGMRECEVRAELEHAMMRGGAEKASFDTIVAAGPDAAVPHHHTAERPVRRGEMVIMDFGAVREGYCSDITRTVFVGRPDRAYRERYGAVRSALEAALERMRDGVACRDVDAAARRELAKAGLAKRFTHSLGHGVGVEIHEAPSLNPRSRETLREGMVVTVEPGVYIEGWGGIRVEEMVVVRAEDRLVLNTLSRGIWSV